MALLDINNLGVSFATGDGTVNAVNGVSFALNRGDTLGIVGDPGRAKASWPLRSWGFWPRTAPRGDR